MAYSPTTWVEGSTKLGPTNMNHLELGLQTAAATADAAIAKPASPSSNDGLVWNGSTWVNAKLVNANIDPAAAIAYTKLSLAGSIVNNDISGSAAISASKLASYPSDGTKFLAGDGTWKSVAATTYRKTSAKAVNTTVSATDLLNAEITVAAGAMGTTGVLRLTAWGDYLNNSGGAVAPPRFQFVFGGTTVFDTGISGTVPSAATRYGWRIAVEVMNTGASNAQSSHFLLTTTGGALGVNGFNAFTTGEGVYWFYTPTGTFALGVGDAMNTSSLDTSTSKTVVLNVINGSASASYETKLVGALAEVI